MIKDQTYSPGPGAILGPQLAVDDPGELVKEAGTAHNSDTLIGFHSKLYPADLILKLALPRDPERSAALDLEEVHAAVSELKGPRAFFDPETDTLLDASVKGDPSQGYYVSLMYQVPSGRTARAVIPYEKVPESARAYEEARKSEADFAVALRSMQGKGRKSAASSDSRAQGDSDELKLLERRLREVEEAQAAVIEERDRLRDPEPWEGYDEQDAETVKERIASGGSAEFGSAGLARVKDYESRHKDRVSIKRAVDSASSQG